MENQPRVAPRQRTQLDSIKATLASIDSAVDDANRPEFQALIEKTDGWAAKVAVIGQVKAGKSTFLNAFLGQHDFLPSDVNPWTSVVTNLRINIPNDPETGVSFEFFSEEDWNEIIEGKSAISDLSEELLPGFDADLLREQSKELRGKAQRRLGSYYQTMLGSTHDFNFSSPDLLKRYVCAGPGSDHGLTDESLGRYASLTREANIYMQDQQFLIPTILTDTPGVNDPFLVRDEVTCRALDRSDLFIMVLSAHQPLTDIDVGLIRLLSKESDRDVLIFVNRLDELDQYDACYEQLLEDVSVRLEEAIPGIEFQIVLGSGFMADAVLSVGMEGHNAREELDTPSLSAYLKSAYGYCPKDQNERLVLASGLQKVREALSEMIDTGVARRQVDQLWDDIRAQIAATKYSASNTIGSISNDITQFQEHDAESLTETMTSEVAALKKAGVEIEKLLGSGQTQFTSLVIEAQADLEGVLQSKIEAFLDSQETLIESSLMLEEDQEIPSEPLTIFLGALHTEIETAVSDQYANFRTKLDWKLKSLSNFATNQVSEVFKNDFQGVSLDNLPYETFSTTLTLAKRSIETGLVGKRSLAFWKKKSIDLAKTVKTVKTLASAELRPAVETLLKAFAEAQQARIDGGMERIELTRQVVERSAQERAQSLEEHKERLATLGVEGGSLSTAVQTLQKQADDLEKMNEALTQIEEELAGNTSQTQAA